MDYNNCNAEQIRHISHEIRNNLSICDIYSEILKKHIKKENIQNQSVDNAINCIQNAIKLIGVNLYELKSFQDTSIKECDFNDIIQTCINMSHAYILEKDITITFNPLSNIKILVDENKFQSCIINLLKNAIEAISNAGNISVTTNLENTILFIRISNNGTPIPKEIQKDIFNDGFTTKSTGSGIGLYLSKKFLEEFNSTLSLVKSDKELTEFEITVKTAQ